MKYSTYILFFCLPFSIIANEKNLALVEKSIVNKDLSKLEKLIKTSENATEIVTEIKKHREKLIKLAESSEVLNEAKEKLGEKKYTKWKRIGLGGTLVGYSALKLILGSVYGADDLASSEAQGFFSYDRLTDLGIGFSGAYYIYYGITGKDPQAKVNNAVEILKLLNETFPEEII